MKTQTLSDIHANRLPCPQDGNFRVSQLGAKPVKRRSYKRLTAALTADLVKIKRRGDEEGKECEI